MTSSGSAPEIDVFPLLRLKGVVCGYADLESPWAALQRSSGRHWLYIVKKGSCWVAPVEEARAPIRLAEGDVLAVANDSPHSLRHSERAASAASRPLPVCAPRDRGRAEERATTVLVVASVPCASEPLSELFPTIFHVPADGSPNSLRIAALVRLIEDEIAAGGEPGSSAVVDRLGDLILIELLRVETRRVSEVNPVWVHGIADPLVARLVTHFHATPGGHWDWDSMCRAASLSRSALDRRFRSVLGQSPKRYLFALRMRLGAAALAEGRKSIAEIASSVGYESGAAFHRAFHRTLGLTPGVYGRRSRNAE